MPHGRKSIGQTLSEVEYVFGICFLLLPLVSTLLVHFCDICLFTLFVLAVCFEGDGDVSRWPMMSVDDVSSCEGTKSLGYLYPPPSSGKYDALKWGVEMEGTHTHKTADIRFL